MKIPTHSYLPVRSDEEHEPKENNNIMESMMSGARFDKKFIEERFIQMDATGTKAD